MIPIPQKARTTEWYQKQKEKKKAEGQLRENKKRRENVLYTCSKCKKPRDQKIVLHRSRVDGTVEKQPLRHSRSFWLERNQKRRKAVKENMRPTQQRMHKKHPGQDNRTENRHVRMNQIKAHGISRREDDERIHF